MTKPYLLLKGDCLEVMKKLPDNSVGMVLADLPYQTTNLEWDSLIPFDQLWEAYNRVVKPKGNIILFGSQPFTSLLVTSNIKGFRYEVIWSKNKCGSPGLAKKRIMKTHENILVFSQQPGGTYNPQMEVGEPYSRKSKNPEGYVGRKNDHGYGMKPRTEFTNEGTRYPKSVLNISRDFSAQQQVHPTQKPVPLCEYLIKTFSNERDIVLDNVMGSGSTGVACMNTNRKFIGIEMSDEYFEIAEGRISSTSGRISVVCERVI